jgi:CHAD domain-containing protein
VRAHRDELLQNDPGVREGDPDAVHDMRVATRRLRSTLGTFRQFLGDTDPLRDELRWTAGLLGAVRDGDVLADELIEEISHTAADMVPGPVTRRIRRRLARDVSDARSELHDALNSDRYFAMLDALDRFVDATVPEATAKALRKRTRKRLAKADLGVETALRSDLIMPSDERDHALHDARKAYKKSRYAVELLTPLYGKPAKRLVILLKALQDLLGEHQDAVVAADLLRELGEEAHASGESEFGYGVLCEQQTLIADDRRQKVPAVYRKASKPKVRAFLD